MYNSVRGDRGTEGKDFMPEESVNFVILLESCWALNLSYLPSSLELSREVFKRRGKRAEGTSGDRNPRRR